MRSDLAFSLFLTYLMPSSRTNSTKGSTSIEKRKELSEYLYYTKRFPDDRRKVKPKEITRQTAERTNQNAKQNQKKNRLRPAMVKGYVCVGAEWVIEQELITVSLA